MINYENSSFIIFLKCRRYQCGLFWNFYDFLVIYFSSELVNFDSFSSVSESETHWFNLLVFFTFAFWNNQNQVIPFLTRCLTVSSRVLLTKYNILSSINSNFLVSSELSAQMLPVHVLNSLYCVLLI